MNSTDSLETTDPNAELSPGASQKPTSHKEAFDYTALTPEVRIAIQNKTSELKSLIRRNIQDIIDIGQKLIEVKEQLGHGNFTTWLKSEFDWSIRTAARFMQVANQFKFANLANLNIDVSALYLLAEPSISRKAREQALDLAKQGEIISYNKAKEIISGYQKKVQLSTCNPATKATEGNSVTPLNKYKNIHNDYERDTTVQFSLGGTSVLSETISVKELNDTSEQKILPKEESNAVEQLQLEPESYIRILNIENQNSDSRTETSRIFNLSFAGICVNFEGNPQALIMLFEQMQKSPTFTKEIFNAARLQSINE